MIILGREEGESIAADETTIEAVLAGDRDAFRHLIERYRALLYTAIWRIVRSQPDAEDLVQETFLQIYRSLPQFRNSQAVGLKTWMMRIATHKAIDWTRKQRTAPSLEPHPDPAGSPDTFVEALLLRREEKRELHALLHRLPNDYAQVVELFYFQEKSYQEIAEAQQVAVKTVESRLYRAKRLLRQFGKEEKS